MVKVCLLNNLQYTFDTKEEYNKIKDNIKKDLIIKDINQTNPTKFMQDIIVSMLNYCNAKFNMLNTYKLSKTYYLLTFQNEYKEDNIKDNIISYLIDNSEIENYDDKLKYMHNNIGCIIKTDNKNLLDINEYKIMKLIKYSNLHSYYLITPYEIKKEYYTNNPIYKKEEYNLYITHPYKIKNNIETELRIHFKFDEEINFINYNDCFDINKELIYNIINKYNIFKNNKENYYPINTNIIISLHNKNQNINITKELFNKIKEFINKK